MLTGKSSVHFQPQNFDPLHSFYKSIHTKPPKFSLQLFQKKDCITQQSQMSSKRIRGSQIRKSGTYFSNCSLFQVKRAKLKQYYQKNHSSGWLEKILTRKSTLEKQQFYQSRSSEKINKLIDFQNNANKIMQIHLQKGSIKTKVPSRRIKLSSEIEEPRTLTKMGSKKPNHNLRLTQPTDNDLNFKKQGLMKLFANEFDINICPWDQSDD